MKSLTTKLGSTHMRLKEATDKIKQLEKTIEVWKSRYDRVTKMYNKESRK